MFYSKKLKLAKQQVASAKKLKLPVLMRKSSSDSNKGSATPVLKGERKRRPKSEKEGAKKPRQQPQQSLLAQFESLTPSNSDQPYANTEGSFPMQGSQSTEALTQPLLESVERQLLDDVGGSVEVFGSLTAVGGDAGAQQGGVVRGLPPPLPPGVPADLTKMIEDLTSVSAQCLAVYICMYSDGLLLTFNRMSLKALCRLYCVTYGSIDGLWLRFVLS